VALPAHEQFSSKRRKNWGCKFLYRTHKKEDATLAEQVEQKMNPTNAVFAEWDGELW
jgi:hypothetical protein